MKTASSGPAAHPWAQGPAPPAAVEIMHKVQGLSIASWRQDGGKTGFEKATILAMSVHCEDRLRWNPSNCLLQLPEGVGRSRPLALVSLTSGAGGASSPATAGVMSAGTEAIVAVGLAAL